MAKFFGIDPAKQEITTEDGRLQRPWTVVIFGVLISVAMTGVIFRRATDRALFDDKTTMGMMVFAVLALLMSCAYAYIGARHSLKLAKRIVGWTGMAIIVGGLVFFVSALMKQP